MRCSSMAHRRTSPRFAPPAIPRVADSDDSQNDDVEEEDQPQDNVCPARRSREPDEHRDIFCACCAPADSGRKVLSAMLEKFSVDALVVPVCVVKTNYKNKLAWKVSWKRRNATTLQDPDTVVLPNCKAGQKYFDAVADYLMNLRGFYPHTPLGNKTLAAEGLTRRTVISKAQWRAIPVDQRKAQIHGSGRGLYIHVDPEHDNSYYYCYLTTRCRKCGGC